MRHLERFAIAEIICTGLFFREKSLRPEPLHIEVSRSGKSRRNDVDVVRAIFWFEHLRIKTGSYGPAAVERAIEPAAARKAKKGLYHRNAWYAYAKGLRTPQLSRRLRAAATAPGSLMNFNHILWKSLRTDLPLGRRVNRLLRATGPRTEALLFKKVPDGGTSRRGAVTSRILRRIESHPNQDALAALTILLREAAEKQNFELAQEIVERLLRVLLVYSINPYAMYAAPLLYQLFLQRIFPLAGGQGARFDFEGYDFREASRRLLDHLLWAEDTGQVNLRSGEEARYLLRRLREGSGLVLQWRLLPPLFPGLESHFRDPEWIKAWRAGLRIDRTAATSR